MSAPITEFVIESVIRDGLNELRLNPDRFDDLFSKFTEAFFNNQYGQDKIEELKTYIVNNQIKIVHSLNIQPSDFPCISIQLVQSLENEEDQQFGDEYLDEDETKIPDVFIDNVIVTGYDSTTGKLSIDNSVNLAIVKPKLLFKDAVGTEFIIGSGNSNLSGNKYINIGKNAGVNVSGPGQITSNVSFTRTERKMIRLRETILLGCHASNNLHLAKFLYYILIYIIKSRKLSLIERGIHLDKGNGTIFDREGQFEGEHVFSRSIQLHALTEFIWDQGQVNIMDCFDISLKATDGKEEVDLEPEDEE